MSCERLMIKIHDEFFLSPCVRNCDLIAAHHFTMIMDNIPFWNIALTTHGNASNERALDLKVSDRQPSTLGSQIPKLNQNAFYFDSHHLKSIQKRIRVLSKLWRLWMMLMNGQQLITSTHAVMILNPNPDHWRDRCSQKHGVVLICLMSSTLHATETTPMNSFPLSDRMNCGRPWER